MPTFSFLDNSNPNKDKRGGGWSFLENITRELREHYVQDPDKADVLLIPSASMVDRATVTPYVGKKKIVLRVDNWLKDSRNRGTGMSRMIDFAEIADVIVYQSKWAQGYLGSVLGYPDRARVILNGSSIRFDLPKEQHNVYRYLYARQNRDDSKQQHVAFYEYQMRARQFEEQPELWIVGEFSPEITQWNFDLGNMPVKYFGSVPYSQMPDIMSQCDALLYSYFNDACSNTLSEALMARLEIVDCSGMLQTGGAKEQMQAGVRTTKQMADEYYKVFCDSINL